VPPHAAVLFAIVLCVGIASGCHRRAPPAPTPVVTTPPAPLSATEVEERLKTLLKLRDDGAISETEYQSRRKAILEGI
jgi:hypothetical protein